MGNHVARGQGYISFGKLSRDHQVPRSCSLCCPDLSPGLKNQRGWGRTSAYFRGRKCTCSSEPWPRPYAAVV